MANTPKTGDSALDAAASEPSIHPADSTPSASQATSDATAPEPGPSAEPVTAEPVPPEEGAPEIVEADTTARAFDGVDDFDEQTAPVRMPRLDPEPADEPRPRRSRSEVDENAKTQIFTPGQLQGLLAPPAEPARPSEPPTFDALALPDALREAITAMGWSLPTAVQLMTFPRVTAGRDVLVQSQTGSGKTGAFCLPWLAQRFEADDAARTGVQLLVLTPTRELAKQVCEQLEALGRKSGVRTLPVYGGTAMQPRSFVPRSSSVSGSYEGCEGGSFVKMTSLTTPSPPCPESGS